MMANPKLIKVSLLAVEYTSPSTLYGFYDVFSSVGVGWETFISGEPVDPQFEVRIVACGAQPFTGNSGVLIAPDLSIEDDHDPDIIVCPGMIVPASGSPPDFDPKIFAWLRRHQDRGVLIGSACTGAVLLGKAGVLDGWEASSHYAWADQFRVFFPEIKMRLELNLCISGTDNLLVTAGGTTAWQELALYLITRFCGVDHAMHTAKLWLIPDRDVSQASFSSLCKGVPHNDSAINRCQMWISKRPEIENPVAEMTAKSGLPPTTFARRFKKATGYSPIDYVHLLRIGQAKLMLEDEKHAVDHIGRSVGYEDTSSFRRIFKRKVGLTPGIYRRKFGRGRFEKFVQMENV